MTEPVPPSYPRLTARVMSTGATGAPQVLEQVERDGGQVRWLGSVAEVHAGAPVHLQLAFHLAAGERPHQINLELSRESWELLRGWAGARVLEWLARPTFKAVFVPCQWVDRRLRPSAYGSQVFDALPALLRSCTRLAHLQELLGDPQASECLGVEIASEMEETVPHQVEFDSDPLLALVLLYAGDGHAAERALLGEFDALELTHQQWSAAAHYLSGLRPDIELAPAVADAEDTHASRPRERQAA